MVKGMWYEPEEKTFGCLGHSKCDAKCLRGKGSADVSSPHCGAFSPVPEWAEEFRCPRFVYRRIDGVWRCVHDELKLVVGV